MTDLIPDLAAVEIAPPATEEVTGIFAGAAEGAHDIIITGADAMIWYSTAVRSKDLVFAVWPDPEASIVVYAGADHERVGERLTGGTLVLVAGGGLGLDVPHVVQRRVKTPSAVTDFFGLDRVVVSSEEPLAAAVRRLGNPSDVAERLRILGATVTVRLGASTVIAQALAGHVLSSLTLRRADRPGPGVVARVPWTRALGSFQLRYADSLQGINEVMSGSLGPTATIAARSDVKVRVGSLLSEEAGPCDIVAAAHPGGATTFVTDVALAFADIGPVVLTGGAVPPRPVVVLRGQAADVARPHLRQSQLDPRYEGVEQSLKPIVVGPPPAEERERFIAHQWATAQRRAVEALDDGWPHGGPTLVSEARGIGLISLSSGEGEEDAAAVEGEARESATVDGETVRKIASARGWHVIDPALPPVLDTVLVEARRQVSGADAPITARHLSQLRSWGSQPGFWSSLSSATLPARGVEDRIVFPYPPTAVELLRAVVAADGEAAELRRLLGPIKVSLMTALGPEGFTGHREQGGESHG